MPMARVDDAPEAWSMPVPSPFDGETTVAGASIAREPSSGQIGRAHV